MKSQPANPSVNGQAEYQEARKYQPIDCSDYDYVEIACMDHYDIDLVTDAGHITGKAETTLNAIDGEYVCLRMQDGTQQQVRLDRILRLIVRSRPCRFESHKFGSD